MMFFSLLWALCLHRFFLHVLADVCEYALDGVDDSMSFQFGIVPPSSEFTMAVWFKNNRKEKNSHIAQALLFLKNSRSGGRARFSLVISPGSKLQLEYSSLNVVCEVDVVIQTERWYHVAVTGGNDQILKIWLNGLNTKISCFKDKGAVTETVVSGYGINMQKLVSLSPLYVGSLNEDDCFLRGTVADFRYYGKILGANEIYSEMFSAGEGDMSTFHPNLQVKHPLTAPCDGSEIDKKHRKLDEKLATDPSILANRRGLKSGPEFAAILHINGSPELKNTNFGDGYLSAMLSLVEAKLAFMQVWANAAVALPPDYVQSFLSTFGDIARIVPDRKDMLLKVRDSLMRHFQVLVDEEYMWRSYNEYAVRLEMLGHSLALLLKQQVLLGKPVDVSNVDLSAPASDAGSTKSHQHQADKRPMVAIIAPATSKGIDPHKLSNLAIAISLLPSLYATRSRDYDYRVYISANENDAIFSNDVLLTAVFDGVYARAKEIFYKSLHSSSTATAKFPKIHHRLVVVPSSMIPKRALSALFNIPTLLAYEEGCDYFYIGNDDLQFQSHGWTELLVNPLKNNPIFPGLGVSGGIDISDSITPQIEFPFFHRTHVELFPWCGTNPWIFKNWWEDNWLTDIYLPFDSVFYEKGVVVENYVGLEPNEATDHVEVRAVDPRYEVVEGRRTPPFYVEEVERGRERILHFLQQQQHHTGVSSDARFCETRDFGATASGKAAPIGKIPQTPYSGVTNMSYCYQPHKRVPTLASMPIHIHEEALDPCNSGIAEGSHLKTYRQHVHSKELPHASYAPMVPCVSREVGGLVGSRGGYLEKIDSIVQACSEFYAPHQVSRVALESMRVGHLSDEMFHKWMSCMAKIGLGYSVKANSLSRGELCRKDFATGSDLSPYASCKMTIPLNILILHNHCPLFTRYGSDKRLYHIAETLVGLGHRVTFGGAFKSDLESEDDHNRLRNIDAKLYSPLATLASDGTVTVIRDAYEQLLRTVKPDFVIMTMWFWNVPPATDIFHILTRQSLPSTTRIGVLSDDAHSHREEMLLKTAGRISLNNLLRASHIRRSELRAYAEFDVVMTITEDDISKMLSPSLQLEPTEPISPQDQKKLSMTRKSQQMAGEVEALNRAKFQVVRYALSPTEILSDEGLRLRGESGGSLDGSIRAHLSFVGNGANPTNQHALHWFFSEIFPLITAKLPDMRVVIIGADWDYLKEDFPQYSDSALVIRGILNQEDMTSAMLTTKVFISPIVASTGLNTKNLLALSRGLPMVTTPDGSHGLKYDYIAGPRDGSSAPFLVASTAVEFADTVVTLYTNNNMWREMALASLRHARSEFGLGAQAHEIEKAIQIAFSGE